MNGASNPIGITPGFVKEALKWAMRLKQQSVLNVTKYQRPQPVRGTP
jgi:hypothetical protein